MSDVGPVSVALEADLRREVQRNGLVVWLDRDGHYTAFVDRLVAKSKAAQIPYPVAAFRGSHLELMLALADAIPSDDGVGVFLEWRRGFIRKARIDGIRDRYASESRLLQLLRCPAARFLSELEIGVQTDGNNALM